ncbi:MAG TPA: hypothetical protein VMU84_20780 [Thermoanaerobaculia bacterium]|nr:hypothetical protein [Thermoanaerobaculia bacterium]
MSEIEPVTPVPKRGMSTKVIAAIVIVAAFLTGALAGAIADRVWVRTHPFRGPGPHAVEFLLNRLDSRLDLTDQQRSQIAKILERRHERMNAIWAATHPRIRAEVEQTNAEIAAVLTPEQREKFEKLKMRLMPRRRGGEPPPHP